MGIFREYSECNTAGKILHFIVHPIATTKRKKGDIDNLIKYLRFKAIDIRYGTDFVKGKNRGVVERNELDLDPNRAYGYSCSPDNLRLYLDTLNISESDSIVDLGCGRGAAMYTLSKYGFGKIFGVELSADLASSAVRNVKLFSRGNEGRFIVENRDACDFQYYDDCNMFYIYNSFPEKVLPEVIRKIEESVKRKPRAILLMYNYPDWPELVLQSSIFNEYERCIDGRMYVYKNTMYYLSN